MCVCAQESKSENFSENWNHPSYHKFYLIVQNVNDKKMKELKVHASMLSRRTITVVMLSLLGIFSTI